ncbi:DnaB-like helicase C-terminal domain-containing protein [Curtobacterium sp. NPDC087080]|uniref:DnaB-like helicase C-terminal domain-containing protein n=1 Tax=Curtobacterium sp. NPDC087080 TaxID=3363965 RepID=UPI0037FF167F
MSFTDAQGTFGPLDGPNGRLEPTKSALPHQVGDFLLRQVTPQACEVLPDLDVVNTMEGPVGSNRREVVAGFSRGLKILARNLQVPVIALSQLNRNSESTVSGRPKLSDLRESGAIEQDADLVVLLHREKDPQTQKLDEYSIYFDVAKNRHGETDVVRLDWNGGQSTITDGQRY